MSDDFSKILVDLQFLNNAVYAQWLTGYITYLKFAKMNSSWV